MSAATKLICDLARIQKGTMTMQELRQNWSKGQYAAAPQEWALWAIKQATRT